MNKARHEEQVNYFQISKVSNSKNCALFAEDTGGAFLFADERVKKICTDEGLRGIKFEPVFNQEGLPVKGFYQLKCQKVLPTEMIRLPGNYSKIKCPACGKVQYQRGEEAQIVLTLQEELRNEDYFETEAMFGEGIAEPAHIISNRFYKALLKGKIAGGITFTPVRNL